MYMRTLQESILDDEQSAVGTLNNVADVLERQKRTMDVILDIAKKLIDIGYDYSIKHYSGDNYMSIEFVILASNPRALEIVNSVTEKNTITKLLKEAVRKLDSYQVGRQHTRYGGIYYDIYADRIGVEPMNMAEKNISARIHKDNVGISVQIYYVTHGNYDYMLSEPELKRELAKYKCSK